MGFDKDGRDDSEASETETASKIPPNEDNVEEHHPGISRKASESSLCPTEDEDDDEERKIELGPQCTLKEQFEKDKVGWFMFQFQCFFFSLFLCLLLVIYLSFFCLKYY